MDPLKDPLPETPRPMKFRNDPESETPYPKDEESEIDTGEWRRQVDDERESDPDGVMKPLSDREHQREE
jgi:hypothetical protein